MSVSDWNILWTPLIYFYYVCTIWIAGVGRFQTNGPTASSLVVSSLHRVSPMLGCLQSVWKSQAVANIPCDGHHMQLINSRKVDMPFLLQGSVHQMLHLSYTHHLLPSCTCWAITNKFKYTYRRYSGDLFVVLISSCCSAVKDKWRPAWTPTYP